MNRYANVSCNFNCLMENRRIFQGQKAEAVTYIVNVKDSAAQTTNRKSYNVLL